MSDNLRPEDRYKAMRAVRGKGTSLERRLFAALAQAGLKGWRKNYSGLPGKPDVIFVDEKVAIFIDGCFWHGCPHCRRKLPETNKDYWEKKILRNISLAKRHNRELKRNGWKVIRVWGHEMKNIQKVKLRILQSIR